MYILNKLGQGLIFLPTIFCFSYILRPILMVILIPGGLALLALIGGAEVRAELKAMLLEELLGSVHHTTSKRHECARNVGKVKQKQKRVGIEISIPARYGCGEKRTGVNQYSCSDRFAIKRH